MRATLIAIGDELLSGKIKDENLYFASKYLFLAGIEVIKAWVVRDSEKEIKKALKTSSHESEIVIVSGGLGPTPDDKTREAVASLLNVNLCFSRKLWNSIKKRFEERGIHVPETNKKQATFPKGARIIENPLGTAPGFMVKFGGAKLFFLPGVPKEFREMFIRKVLPLITGARAPLMKTFRIFGLPESEIAFRLKEVESFFPQVRISYLPIFPENMVVVSAPYGHKDIMRKVEKRIREQLGNFIFSEGKTMEEVVGELLRNLNFTISIAESCTGGMVSNLLTNVPGSSNYFTGGVATYSYLAKQKILGVSIKLLQQKGAVNETVAQKMAESVRKVFQTDISLSTTGILGPSKGGEREEIGTLYMGLSHKQGSFVKKFYFPLGDRKAKKMVFSLYALDQLRRFLQTEKRLKTHRKLIDEAKKHGIAFLKKPPYSMKLLVFALTSNPPTRAHTKILQKAMEKFGFRSALLVIDVSHADKKPEDTSLEERLEMLKLAFEDIGNSGIALTKAGLYIEKLKLFLTIWKKRRITFLVGADNIKRILDPSFYSDPENDLRFLFSNSEFIVATRNNIQKDEIKKMFAGRQEFLKNVYIMDTEKSIRWISSTDVRKKVMKGENTDDLIDFKVKCFIEERGLYR